MILKGKTIILGQRPDSMSDVLFTTNLLWNFPESDTGFPFAKPKINCLSHHMAHMKK